MDNLDYKHNYLYLNMCFLGTKKIFDYLNKINLHCYNCVDHLYIHNMVNYLNLNYKFFQYHIVKMGHNMDNLDMNEK